MSPSRKRQMQDRKEDGFTLIELMMSMVILSVGLFAVIHLQVVTVRGHRYAWELSEATWISLGVAEDLHARSLQWVDMSSGAAENTLEEVLGDNRLYKVAAQRSGTGAQFFLEDLRSAMAYKANNLAVGPLVQDSHLINLKGEPNQPGGIYRVHYLASYPFLKPNDPLPTNSLVQAYLDVTWDSKDHGENYDWSRWSQPGNYFKRHNLRIPLNLLRTKYY